MKLVRHCQEQSIIQAKRLDMEVGERSNGGRWRQKRQRRASLGISYERSVENLSRGGRETLEMVNQNRPKPLNTIPGTSSVVFDNTSRQYDWLRSGWLVEERRMLSNRLYRVIFVWFGYRLCDEKLFNMFEIQLLPKIKTSLMCTLKQAMLCHGIFSPYPNCSYIYIQNMFSFSYNFIM